MLTMPSKKKLSLVCQDGKERELEIAIVSTPIGEMVIEACHIGLHKIYQKENITDENFHPNLSSKQVELVGQPQLSAEAGVFVKKTVSWLEEYFKNTCGISKICIPNLCPLKSESGLFRDRVLITLAKSVPFGKTVTYGELASMAGSPGAQQAVGSLMAANPFQLLVPCHRVIKSGQIVGQYSGGCRNSVKIWLLEHEGLKIEKKCVITSKK